MNTNKERAREELYQTIQRPSGGQEAYELEIIRAIRAYVLLVHTEACTKMCRNKNWATMMWVPENSPPHPPQSEFLCCGFGWFCPVAQQYLPQK